MDSLWWIDEKGNVWEEVFIEDVVDPTNPPFEGGRFICPQDEQEFGVVMNQLIPVY